jgi:hypothetical protein
MLVASVGTALAEDLGLASIAMAEEGQKRLLFGSIEPLVSAMQQTPVDGLLPLLLNRLNQGTTLHELVAAGALANARTFGGQDYDGYHALMALAPSYAMAQELPKAQSALPVFKVLYRNTSRIQKTGGVDHETLHELGPDAKAAQPTGEGLRDATRRQDFQAAEATLASMSRGSLDDAYNNLQLIVQDDVNVHRVVLAWRSWALLELTGKEHALTMLRQSVRFCCDEEGGISKRRSADPLRNLLPVLLERHGLLARTPGDRHVDEAWIEKLSHTIFADSREAAAEAVAIALAEGVSPEDVGEAISLAANQLVLHDPGRKKAEPGKPAGSVHGASVGVHASDAANAWRNIARVSNPRNTFASLVVGAYHTAGQSGQLHAKPYPFAEHREAIASVKPESLLSEAEVAVRANDQVRACALIHRYGSLGMPERPVFEMLLRYAISEDGALHAEKYYRTVTEEFAASRPTLRWHHLAGLARVTASEYGNPAPGINQARQLLQI